MENMPSRAPGHLLASPSAAQVRAAREAVGLSQTAAGALVHTACRTWQQWEAGDRRMHPAFWELFTLKVSTLTADKKHSSLNQAAV